MTTLTTTTAASPATRRAGAAPAGLDLAQSAARERLRKAQDAMARLEPPDPTYLADEAAWERHRQWTGEDL